MEGQVIYADLQALVQNPQDGDGVRQNRATRGRGVVIAHHLDVPGAVVVPQHTDAIPAQVAEEPDAVRRDEHVRAGRPTLVLAAVQVGPRLALVIRLHRQDRLVTPPGLRSGLPGVVQEDAVRARLGEVHLLDIVDELGRRQALPDDLHRRLFDAPRPEVAALGRLSSRTPRGGSLPPQPS